MFIPVECGIPKNNEKVGKSKNWEMVNIILRDPAFNWNKHEYE